MNHTVLGLDLERNELKHLQILPPKSISIVTKQKENRVNLISRILNSYLESSEIEKVRFFILDVNESIYRHLDDKLSAYTAKYITNIDEIIVLLELLYEEIRSRTAILRGTNYEDLYSYELMKQKETLSYTPQNYITLVIPDIDDLRIKLADISISHRDYVDYLLKGILGSQDRFKLNCIISGTSFAKNYFPTGIYENTYYKISMGLNKYELKDFIGGYGERIPESPINSSIYFKEEFSDVIELKNETKVRLVNKFTNEYKMPRGD